MNKIVLITFLTFLFLFPNVINSSTTEFIKKENAELLELKNKNKIEYCKVISQKYSKIYGLDWKIIYSIMKVESNLNYNAKGKMGEIGLMQITLSSGKHHYSSKITKKDLFNEKTNVSAGCKILRDYLDEYDGNLLYALAAYNAGPSKIKGSFNRKEDPPNKDYIAKITYEKFKLEQLDS